MKSLNEVKQEIEAIETSILVLSNTIENKQKEVDNFEIDQDDFINQYEEMIDECEGEFMGMNASYILRECDPIAYRCGLNDYCDNIVLDGVKEYKDLLEALEELEDEKESLESALDDLNTDLEEAFEEGDL